LNHICLLNRAYTQGNRRRDWSKRSSRRSPRVYALQ